MTIDQRTNKWS